MPPPRTPHVYVVEDDPEIRELVAAIFDAAGYVVSSASDSEGFWRLMDVRDPELVVIDVMLPGEDGLTICRRLQNRSEAGIIMMSARGEPMDRIVGLEVGADDYLCKPFDDRELIARARAVLRRRERGVFGKHRPRYCFAGFELDSAGRKLLNAASQEVALTPSEYDLLLLFAEQPQIVLSREDLMDGLRGRALDVFDRSIDVQVSRLRRKLGDSSTNPQLIRTVRSEGYFLAVPVTVQ